MDIKFLIEALLRIGVTLIVALLIVKWVSYLLNKSAKKWDLDLTVIHVLNDTIKYTIYIIAISIILKWFGIDITALALSIGIVGVAMGFAARDTIANFISGLFILADKSFKVDDIIKVSNQKGRVIKMGFRTTTILDSDNRVITIPNSIFSKNPYLNYTLSKKRRVDLKVNIPHEVDFEKFEEKVKKVVGKIDGVLSKPQPNMIILEITDTGMVAKVTAWIAKPDRVEYYRSIMAKKVKKLLNNGKDDKI